MKLLKYYITILILGLASTNGFCDDELPGPSDCWPPPCVPITDHLHWLVLALIVFGIFKSYQFSRNSVKA